MFHRNLKLSGRLLLGLIGALSGLLAGLGFSLVVTQSGAAIEWVPGLSLLGIVSGALWGAAAPKKLISRIGALGALAVVVVTTFAGLQPVQAQLGTCFASMTLTFDNSQTDLLSTSERSPAIVPVDQEVFAFAAQTAGVDQGVLRVTIGDEGNPLINFESDRVLLWHAQITGGSVSFQDRIVSEGGLGGYSLQNAGITIPPWGRYQAEVSISETDDEGSTTICTESIWLQFAARPFSTPVGLAGGGLTVMGLLGFALIEPVQRRMPRKRTESETGPEEPPAQVQREARPIKRVGPGEHIDIHFEEAASGPDGVRSVPVDPNAALVSGQQYRLVVTVEPGVDVEVDEERDHPLTVSGFAKTFRIKPALELAFFGAKKGIPIDIIPEKIGRHSLSIDILHNGQLLRTEQISVGVVPPGSDVLGAEAPTTRAILAPSLFEPNELDRREYRPLCIVLESDPSDGSANARVYADGEMICAVDSTSASASIADESQRARDALGRVVAEWAQQGGELHRDAAVEGMRNLAVAGRYLHRAVFPVDEVTEGSIGEVARRIADGATIQVNHARSGLGRMTLPWALLYDRTLKDRGSHNEFCADFPHPDRQCPNADNGLVICPSGFWGYRAIIEEPESEVRGEILPPPVGSGDAGTLVGHLMDGLADSSRAQAALDALVPVTWVHNLGDLMATLESSASVAGVYIYTHDARRNDRAALAIGTDHLTPLALEGFAADWDARPMVFLNACSTGVSFPEDALTLIRAFRLAGAAGVISTECPVFDPFAGLLGSELLGRAVSGERVGPALLAMRRALLHQLNPLGLAYGIHGPVDQSIKVLRREAVRAEL